jgi:hypothetical protein
MYLTFMSYLAALGALITILASLTGFFSQQLVQFKDCAQINTTALANISRTNSYAQIGGYLQANVPADYVPMVAAINAGVIQSPGDLTSVLSSGCTSGNCTFSDIDTPSFSTLAISHYCEDSTARIRVINESDIADEGGRPGYLGLEYGTYNESFIWARYNAGILASSWTDQSSPGITAIYFLFRSNYSSADWRVFNCSLFPTVNTYTARIKDAMLEETPVNITYLESLGEHFNKPTVNDRDFNNFVFSYSHRATKDYTIWDGKRDSCEGSDSHAPGLTLALKSSNEPTYVNLTGHTNPSAGWKWWYYPEHCVWTISRFSTLAMTDTLNEIFNGQNVTAGTLAGESGSHHLRVLYQHSSMSLNSTNERIRGLATSMTTIFRTHGGLNRSDSLERAIGTVWVNTTCVYIRWSWIAFPAVMIGLAGVFLVLVALENRGMETDRLWKSSFLAALFCEVEVHEKPAGKEEMEAVAKSTSVSLQRKSSMIRLVRG